MAMTENDTLVSAIFDSEVVNTSGNYIYVFMFHHMIRHIMSCHDIMSYTIFHIISYNICVCVMCLGTHQTIGLCVFLLTTYTLLETGFKPKSQRDSRDILSSSSRRNGRRESVEFCPTNPTPKPP